MIKMNLQLFGGRGSGCGNNPAGKGATATTRTAAERAASNPSITEKVSTKESSKRTVSGTLSTLKEPEAFKSSKINHDLGGSYGKVTISIENEGSRGFRTSVITPNKGRYTVTSKTFAQAKKSVPDLIKNYVDYKDRFKNRKLTRSELAELMNGL